MRRLALNERGYPDYNQPMNCGVCGSGAAPGHRGFVFADGTLIDDYGWFCSKHASRYLTRKAKDCRPARRAARRA